MMNGNTRNLQDAPFNVFLLKVAGTRTDQGGFDRALAVAREFVLDGIWDGFSCDLVIIDPYTVHDRLVFGLVPVSPLALELGVHFNFSPAVPEVLERTTPASKLHLIGGK